MHGMIKRPRLDVETDENPNGSTCPVSEPTSKSDMADIIYWRTSKAVEAPRTGDKLQQLANEDTTDQRARRRNIQDLYSSDVLSSVKAIKISTQDEETQTDADPDSNGSTDQGFKPLSNIDQTGLNILKPAVAPTSSDNLNTPAETARRSTQDEETQTDADPDGTGSTDPGVKPPANIDKTGLNILKPNDQLKTQTSGPYYSDEIYNRIQTSSNKFYPAQTQKQDRLARQMEASKELLYRVYENVIGTLEEFERRCNKRHTKQKLVVSEIDFPDQSDKSDRDVKANMDVQLLLFEEHRKSCPPEFTKKINGELRMKTIYWAAARGEMGLDETDEYTTNLYEILVKDKTHHAVLDQPRKPVEHKTMRDTLQFIMKGNAKAMEIECEYQTDPDKMAKDPKTRKTKIRPYVGAKRICRCKPGLQPYLDQDVPGFLESDIK
ncbi:uncharacterized protein LOC127841181 isoform X7 [Dreissena polymorpha]|uniref:uncharacterized protein LOC127841181 isoform X6 n=1 Tax=Dreissena polymorpha TaxID=45954 RepID=UPI0022644E2C|nr:uncharacterized protein LOC127841181 isoform X6 [Dreissena polymorpha]XP_052225795.1 uncharacterized protein LOC127841181 isoform X7 [Dreissena polymorpha]